MTATLAVIAVAPRIEVVTVNKASEKIKKPNKHPTFTHSFFLVLHGTANHELPMVCQSGGISSIGNTIRFS